MFTAIPSGFLCLYYLNTMKSFHPNFRRLLNLLLLLNSIKALYYVLGIGYQFAKPNQKWPTNEMIDVSCIIEFACTACTLVIVIERGVATAFFQVYEYKYHSKKAILVIWSIWKLLNSINQAAFVLFAVKGLILVLMPMAIQTIITMILMIALLRERADSSTHADGNSNNNNDDSDDCPVTV
ncbi:unnamed protein product [Gongylonema pulchrum]|uniref:Integral membrane protein n=1 Tax=Gongylonema pulchrum TaxID=637853 RepID=A0A183E7F4_9BILA|nr:unnamed protein product [Gongylonema pulchrum]